MQRSLQRWAQACLIAGALAALLPATARAQTGLASEYELKAAYLFNFTKFVEWPPGAYADAGTPTTMCILGKDPFGPALDHFLATKGENGRSLKVRRLARGQATEGCHVLFVSLSEGRGVLPLLQRLQGSGVLTVGESDRFAQQGGVIQFVLEDEQVRFVINASAATRNGLKISSKLLQLARIVSDSQSTALRAGDHSAKNR